MKLPWMSTKSKDGHLNSRSSAMVDCRIADGTSSDLLDSTKIREGKVSLDGQELKAITAFEIKSTTEDGYAEVELTLLAKLT